MIGRTRFVYFMRQTDGRGPVKIGISDSPASRLQTYMGWCPYPMSIIAKLPGTLDTERRFHALFMHLHSHSEWFHWSPEIAGVVEQINAGVFDIASLPPPQSLPRIHVVTPETIRAQVNARRVGKLRDAGVVAPPEVVAALNTYRCEPEERDRRRAVIQAWLDQHDGDR